MPGAERILDFAASGEAAYLSTRHEQLVVRLDGAPSDVTVPLAEIAAIILANPRVTTTQPALAGIMRHGGAIIVCDESHQPAGLMLPLNANATQTQRMLAQVRAAAPIGKRLWKQIIMEKVHAQAASLRAAGRDDTSFGELAAAVRSGDPMNIEAQAAQRYWPLLFNDPEFRRRREADDQNRLLNYGYAVLRAAVGRALCASGLHPSIGIHHHGRNNPWCLADDVMEPYRPLVDRAVVELVGLYGKTCPLDREAKQRLVGIMTDRLASQGEERSTFEWISRTTASLAQVFLGETKILFYPGGLRDAE